MHPTDESYIILCMWVLSIVKSTLASTLDPEDMISACDTQDFVPFGREYVRHHPGEFQIQVQNVNHVDNSIPLVKSFRDFSLHETNSNKVGSITSCVFVTV